MVKHAEERSLADHYIITSSVVKDFNAVESRGIHIEEAIDSLLRQYNNFSGDQKVGLALYQNDQFVYSNRQENAWMSELQKPLDDGNRIVSFQKSDQRTYVNVSGMLPAPYDTYTMVYQYDATDAITAWEKMKNMLFLVGLILSILLALGLVLLLNRIFKPLAQISQTSRNIAAGAYETRLPVLGNDELSEMAQSFNYMAVEVQHQMAELTTAAEKKQQFIDNFAHELHTPLTAIYGYAEYLQKAVMTEDDRMSAISYIMSESRRMQALANQLLDLANYRNDQLAWGEQNITDLFQSVKQTLHKKAMEKEIQIEFYSEIEVIWGDGYLLKSLFVNLMDNAIKACGSGGHIIVNAVMEAGKSIISIKDNGKGMPPDIIRHITEPFYREERSRNRRDGGAGLGLAICQQIVLHHGAELEFMSLPGEGTTAKVIFTTS
ncbi:sensor histidine kinase [Sporosarcina sp. ACRSL]|uniref:sensor histidine kinase n=1 Tax=Sporosarcina sp. ACRSL TaxID=2918215 RepID=UPI001EF7073D|nr:HAMP domain-containing sensor histidine kinase [Sporosarcina sp. ACRSL]